MAVLREKGPHSGSAFSNPGLVADAPAGLKVTMKTADVKIHLRAGEGDTLKADCTAEFEMEDSSPAELAGQLYLVGFPVTGLSSKIVTIDNFAVKVDGKEPATVLRQAIAISRRESKLKDNAISGALDAHLAPKTDGKQWSVGYIDESWYRASYVWQQTARPKTITKVQVAYSVTLHPQSIHYSKSYEGEASDWEVIPFGDIKVDKWKDQYYFFDYVLLSGATWDGPIGRETIEVTTDSALHHTLHPVMRERPIGCRPGPETGIGASEGSQSWDFSKGTTRWELENAKPMSDLLFSIPVSAVRNSSSSQTK